MLGVQTWRIFCAVELPESVRRLVLRHVQRLKEAVPDARASWSRDGNVHLTLKFLGEIPQTSVPEFSTAVSQAVAGLTPFSIGLEQAGAFPKLGQPRVLWIGIEDIGGKLGRLHARLEDEAAKAGFAKEARAFHPHLTLARLRKPQHAQTLASAHKAMEFQPADVTISELLVIRSELSSAGSKYTVISRHPLGLANKL